MDNEIQVFGFEGTDVRVVMLEDAPWFVGKDVCLFFGDTDHKRSLGRIDDDEKCMVSVIDSLGRTQQATAVNEQGLYALLFSFQPEMARKDGGAQNDPHITERIEKLKKFKKWVTSVVLPSIRKTGSYSIQQLPDFTNPAIAARAWADEYEGRIKAEKKIALDAPKVEFYDTVVDSKDAIDMGEAAKALDFENMGRNKLFEYLRQKKVLNDRNIPYQKFIDAEMFRVIETSYTQGADTKIAMKTLIYQKGLDFVAKILRQDGYVKREVLMLD